MPSSKSWNAAGWNLLLTGSRALGGTTRMSFSYLAARRSQRVVASGPGQTSSTLVGAKTKIVKEFKTHAHYSAGAGVGAGIFQLFVIIVVFCLGKRYRLCQWTQPLKISRRTEEICFTKSEHQVKEIIIYTQSSFFGCKQKEKYEMYNHVV